MERPDSEETWGRYTCVWGLPDEDENSTEQTRRYHPGGLHPVHLEDRYPPGQEGEKYRVLHKLGFGSYSHVWFGQNLALTNPNSRGVVLKFIASKCTGKTNEVEINRYLSSRSTEDVGFRNISLCLDTFQVTGPNGVHNVIVTDPAIPLSSIEVDLDERDIVRQLFCGVSFLHKHGVVHRDLHLGNIAIEFPFFRTAGVKTIMKASRHPVCHPCVMVAAIHPPSLPKYLVEKAAFCIRLSRLMREEASEIVVKLLDFGCAFRPGTSDVLSEDQGGPPLMIRAPECLIPNLIANVPLFVHVSDPVQDPPSISEDLTSDPCMYPPLDDFLVDSASPDSAPVGVPSAPYLSSPVAPQSEMQKINLPWSFQSDIWMLGCTLFLRFSHGKHHMFSRAMGAPQYLLRDMSRYLGPMPPKFRLLLEASAEDTIQRTTLGEEWDRMLSLDRIESAQSAEAVDIDASQLTLAAVEASWARLEQKILTARSPWRRAGSVEEEEARRTQDTQRVRGFFSLLKQMLRWDPDDRISAYDALDSEFLKEV